MPLPKTTRLAALLSLIAFASLGADDPNTSSVLFEATPKAAPYLHEIDGNLAITFVHDIDIKQFEFGAAAEDLDGKSHGNWKNSSKLTTEDIPPLVRVVHDTANEIGDLATTTITFHHLPLSKVKSIKIFVISSKDPIPETVIKLPAYFGPPPATPSPLTLSSTPDAKGGPSVVTTSAGLTATATASSSLKISAGKLLEAHLHTATVTDAKGDLIIKADSIDIHADAQPPATAPAPASR